MLFPSTCWETVSFCKICHSSHRATDWIVRRLVTSGKRTLPVTITCNVRFWKPEEPEVGWHSFFLIGSVMHSVGIAKLACSPCIRRQRAQQSMVLLASMAPRAQRAGVSFLILGRRVLTQHWAQSHGVPTSTFWLHAQGMVCKSQAREAQRRSCGQNCENRS